MRDARKLELYPSVTTVLQLLAKPGLDSWKYGQIIEAAWGGSSGDTHEVVLASAFATVDLAADFGTQVHAGISSRLLGQEFFSTDIRVLQCVRGFWEWYDKQKLINLERTEHVFVNQEWGYAGTVDSIGGVEELNPVKNGTHLAVGPVFKPAIFDFKTQEADSLSDFNLYDPDYPLQLAGYALGTGNPDHKRVSVMISRTTPGLVKLHEWGDNDRYNAMWVCLLGLWQLKHKYYPGERMQEVLKPWMK